MNLQDICEETVADMEGCLGCAVVNLESGLPLAIKAASASLVGQDALELLASASVEYFRGRMMWQLQLTISSGELGTDNFAYEIQTTTEDTYNFMSVVPGRESTVLVLILDKATNLGLARISVRHVLQRVSESDDGPKDSKPTESPVTPVAVSSAFAHTPNRANTVGSAGTKSEAVPSSAHVPYRDVPAADERDPNENTPNPESTVREWRGGLGRKNH